MESTSNSRVINVRCAGNDCPRYDNKVWAESIDRIVSLNGRVVKGKDLKVDSLKRGDE